jgi:nitrate reductase NapE component
MVVSCGLMAAGLLLLVVTFPILAVAIVIYAGGYGIMWIARGTLPLALFGPTRYATLMGRLAFPSLIVQALAPSAGALVIESLGAGTTVAMLTAFAIANAVLVGLLWAICRRARNEAVT